MEFSSDFDTEKYSPDNKNQAELEKDQQELLSYFEEFENQLSELRNSKYKNSNKNEIKHLMHQLIDIENLWKSSRQILCQIQNSPYEDIGIVQYRMLLFLEKRKAYRESI